MVLAKYGHAQETKYDEIDKAPEEKARGITINTAHVEYETDTRHYAHVDCPGHADSRQEHDNGRGADGRGHPGGFGGGRPDAADAEDIVLAKQVGVPSIVVYLNKVDMVDDEEL